MAHYRIYTLDRQNKVVSGFDISLDDDQEAVALLHAIWASGEQVEVWRGTFKLCFTAP